MHPYLRKYTILIPPILLIIALLSFGIAIGMVIEKYTVQAAIPNINFQKNVSQEIPLIFLEKIENGILYGTNSGQQVRFFIGNTDTKEVVPKNNGAFSFSVIDILPNLHTIPAPQGAIFVASVRGTTYWPLDAPQAALITPKNRTFFFSTEEAEQSGYKKGE